MVKKFACIVLIIITLMLLAHCYAMEMDSFQGAQSTYEWALANFKNGKESYSEVRALFASIPRYLESSLYICYLDSIQALETEDLETAFVGFHLLQKARFQDSNSLFLYVSARRAERIGNYHEALSLYNELNIYDSQERLSALREMVYGINSPIDETPPIHAKKGGYAMVKSNDVDVWETPERGESFARLPFAEFVRINSFAYDSDGRLFVEITIDTKSAYAVKPLREAKNGYVRAHFLYFLSESETLEEGFRLSNPLIRGNITWTGSVIKQNAAIYDSMTKGKAIQTVQPGDTILIMDQIINGKEYYQVMLPDFTVGYIATDCVAPHPEPNIQKPTPMKKPDRQVRSSMLADPQSEENIFDFALLLMLNGGAENYQRAMVLFSKAEHESAAFYMLYANLLSYIENEEFEKARQALASFEETGYFERKKAYAYRGTSPYEPIEIPEPDVILNYLAAREFESQGRLDMAYTLYEKLCGYLDSPQRGAYVGAMIADSLATPSTQSQSEDTGIESALQTRPLSPLAVNILSSDPTSPDQEQLYAFRENTMKRMENIRPSNNVHQTFSSVSADTFFKPEEIKKLIVNQFSRKLFDAFEERHIFSQSASFFEDIVIQKIISIDLSSDMKRWNVYALLKMVEQKTKAVVYLPVQMSDSGRLSSPYFTDAADSIDSFVQMYPSLLPKAVGNPE